MQLLTSVIQTFEYHFCESSDQRVSAHWEKVALCRQYLLEHAYDKFQRMELPYAEKRRWLLKTLPNLNRAERAFLLDHLPEILPDQRMRSSLISDPTWMLSHTQIHALQLTEDTSIALLKQLVDQDHEYMNMLIIDSMSRSLYRAAKIREVFKAVARRDVAKGLLANRLFQRISSDLFTKNEQYRCAKSCFKIYDRRHGLKVIHRLRLTSEVIAAYPHLHEVDPMQLKISGYSAVQLRQIYSIWIERGNEQSLHLAKGKREAWEVSKESMQAILKRTGKMHPRNLVRLVYQSLDATDKRQLDRVGFTWAILNRAEAHLLLCDCLLKNPQILFKSKKREQLTELLYNTATIYRSLRMNLLELLNGGVTIPSLGHPFFLFIVKHLSDEDLEKYSLAILRSVEAPHLFPVLLKLAKRPVAHYDILNNMHSFALAPAESKDIANEILKNGNELSVEALMEVLICFNLSPEDTVDILLNALDRFPQLATIPLLQLGIYKLPADARRDFLLRWNERYLIQSLPVIMGTAFYDLPLDKEEFQLLFMDALSWMDLDQKDQVEWVFQRFHELKFSHKTKELIAQIIIRERNGDEKLRLEAFKLKPL